MFWYWYKKWRRNRLGKGDFPKKWLQVIERNVPYYRFLPEPDKKELQRHILIFLGEKRFEGCGGLEMTDEIKVTIAAQACILLLHRRTGYYPGLSSVLVYPQAYVAREVKHLGRGVVIEGANVRLGESWQRGSVVLSWDDVQKGAADIHDGHNVVLHEFAHQLDGSGGKGDSTKVLQSRSRYITWARVLQKDYHRLRRDVDKNRQTLLDRYGASNPAEFFAVATECFFEKPRELRTLHSRLYNELKEFYQQDPAELSDTQRQQPILDNQMA
jgi:Mlc titration factor MtfA (ptsG expression regulator)